ncbi:aldo/keto reductase [Longimicrobium sp.]|uniref:aldo/keto reductase n=1 Tax=Longimicrobium sp. TaxID=2029185 RepID=UPI002E2F757D|nr:aldo/keto reductase [Longimicrobium sp.]HEX6042664.1 aldo/keto reductase [Longimicrobium sp.]
MQTVQLGRTGRRVTRVGLGGMPLSIQGRPDRARAKDVIRRAVELGVNFIDTADVYCLDDADLGHNERLIAETLDALGARDDVTVATKGGLTRPEGRWENDGRPEHLRRACEHSLRMLGTDRIDLYQLHAPDRRVPFGESVGAVARLYEEGKVASVGLSNVSLMQVEAALALVPVTSVQNRYNPWDRSSELDGIIRFCDQRSITFLPYSPVGGARRVTLLRESEELREIGARHGGATPEELVLAWILGVSPSLAVIPGASRPASIESSVRAASLHLDDRTRRELEEAFRALPA